jgi:glycosyltransferase involved in cell wall biosynthesis
MEKVNVIYFGNVLETQGINSVTNSFLQGKNYFKNYGLHLTNIFSSSGIIKCDKLDALPIGIHETTYKYKLTRKFRLFLKTMFNSRIALFAWMKIKLNFIYPAKKVIAKYKEHFDGDYLIFQDVGTAYWYYKDKTINHKKSIVIIHSGNSDIYDQLKLAYPSLFRSSCKKYLFGIYEHAMGSVTRTIFLSKKAAQFFQDKYAVDYVYNGVIDVRPNIPRKINTPIQIVCVGSMNYIKGHEIIIESLNLLSSELLRKIKCEFIGGGPQLNELKNLSKRYNLDEYISFLGVRKDISEILKHKDCFILMSLTEGLPMAIIEAMREGLFIISTAVGGIPEILTSDFSVFVKRDPIELKNILEHIVTESVISEYTQKSSRKHFEQFFTLEKMIQRYSDILKSL